MKTYNLKKILVALGLATGISLSVTGCGSDNQQENVDNISENEETVDNISENEEIVSNISESEEKSFYNIEDYSLIYLNGNLHLATKKEGEGYCDYYDVKNGEFIGRVLELKGDQELVFIRDKYYYLDADYQDYEHFDGEYGYGKVIPVYSVISVSNFCSNNTLTQEEYDFLSSNTENLKSMFLQNYYYNKYSLVDYYSVKANAFWGALDPAGVTKYPYEPYEEKVLLKKYVCEMKEGNRNIFLGYRCSYCEKDKGYEYVYDILTGTIQYIGKLKENSFLSVTESEYDNSAHESIWSLIENFKTCSDENVKKDTNDVTLLDNENEEKVLVEDSCLRFSAEELYVFDSRDTFYSSSLESNQAYYFLKFDEDWVLGTSYIDLYHLDGFADLMDENFFYYDGQCGVAFSNVSDNTCALKSFNEFLSLNGLCDLIQDSYSKEEIDKIYEYVNSLVVQRSLQRTQENS